MTDNGGPLGADLTPREREVLAMVAAGMTNREIGEALFISESTAGVHVSNLMAKLGVSSRTEAATVAYRAGLVETAAGISPSDAVPESGATAEGGPPQGGWRARLSHSFQNQMEHHPVRVAAFGIGGLAILSFITIGLAMAVFGEPLVGGDGDGTPSPRPAASEVASASPRPSDEPSETPTPIGGAGINLEIDGLAEILVDDLVLRAEPGTGTIRLGQLPGGATAFVLAGPITEDGYAWYQLAAVDPYGAGCGSAQPEESLVCRDWLGWAAAGGQDGEAWLAPVEPVCPAPGNPTSIMALKPLEGLACFGSSPMTLRLYAPAGVVGGGCVPGDPFTPLWLHPACGPVYFVDSESLFMAGALLSVHIAPSLGSCVGNAGNAFAPDCPLSAIHGRWVKVTVHLDDPQAQSCSSGFQSPGQEATILLCRAALVATAITADDGLGTLDQHQDTWVPEFPIGYQPHTSTTPFFSGVAQTFRAGMSGDLAAVQLQLTGLLGSTGPLVVEVHRDDPDGELLATSRPSSWSDLPLDAGSCLPPQCLALNRSSSWVTIRFDDPARLSAGQVYAMVLASGPINGSNVPAFLLGASTADTYGAGTAWVRGPDDGDVWQSYASGADLTFRTIVR